MAYELKSGPNAPLVPDPTNPRQSILVRHENLREPDFPSYDIFLLRYSTPDFLFNVISDQYMDVYNYIIGRFFSGTNEPPSMARLGVFKFEFTYGGNTTFKVKYVEHNIDEQNLNLYPIGRDNFFELLKQFPHFIEAIFYKALLELKMKFPHGNTTRYEFGSRTIEQTVAIDMIANRAGGSRNVFHLDTTPGQEVNYFTLTYILPEDVLIKAATIIARSRGSSTTPYLSVVAGNGTTIGIDNQVVLHATPDEYVDLSTATGFMVRGPRNAVVDLNGAVENITLMNTEIRPLSRTNSIASPRSRSNSVASPRSRASSITTPLSRTDSSTFFRSVSNSGLNRINTPSPLTFYGQPPIPRSNSASRASPTPVQFNPGFRSRSTSFISPQPRYLGNPSLDSNNFFEQVVVHSENPNLTDDPELAAINRQPSTDQEVKEISEKISLDTSTQKRSILRTWYITNIDVRSETEIPLNYFDMPAILNEIEYFFQFVQADYKLQTESNVNVEVLINYLQPFLSLGGTKSAHFFKYFAKNKTGKKRHLSLYSIQKMLKDPTKSFVIRKGESVVKPLSRKLNIPIKKNVKTRGKSRLSARKSRKMSQTKVVV